MTSIEMYLWTVVGVVISFVLPPLLRAVGVRDKSDPTASVSAFVPRLKSLLTSRYAAITAVSFIVSLILVALLEQEINTWKIALISGMGWQSILARTLSPGS